MNRSTVGSTTLPHRREISRLRSGPGGIGCPCCNPYGCHPRNMKHRARRLVRRKTRQAIKVALVTELAEEKDA